MTFEVCFTGILGLPPTFMGRFFDIHINPVNILQMPKHLCYSHLRFAILSFMLTAKPTKGFVMIGDWPYIVGAIFFYLWISLSLYQFLLGAFSCVYCKLTYICYCRYNCVAQQAKTTLVIKWEFLDAHRISEEG
ncbi:MAG: hypothetical protein U9N83_17655 [Thermodesulfobacteriota bacterium]|nr:hypothetical protein [Thermodesulfobacteriota bacterium]